jgi:DNA-binding MarR family transcriptional regulator
MWNPAVRPLSDAPMTRAAIVATAFDILDEKGFERLSLRRLTERLNTDPATLRRHFARRRMLIEAMAATMARDADIGVDAKSGWRDALRLRAIAARRAMLARRDGAIVMARGLSTAPLRDPACIEMLAASGFAQDAAADALEMVDRFTVGWTLGEQAVEEPEHLADIRFATQLDAVLRALEPAEPVAAPADAPPSSRPHILQIRLANMLRDTRESADIAYARTTRLIDIDRRILLVLETRGDLVPARISALLGMDKAQVSRAVRRLEEKQFVAREGIRSPLCLTIGGRTLAQRLGSLADLRNREIACNLSAMQINSFLLAVNELTVRAILLLDQERKLIATALTNASPEHDDFTEESPLAERTQPASPLRILPALTALSAYTTRSAALAFRRLAGLSNFEACVLIAIGEAAPLRWPDLIETIGRDQSQAGRTVRLLTGIGLVARSGGPERRDGAFTLTGKGKRVHALLRDAGQQRSAFLTQNLSGEQLQDFSAAFDVIVGNAAAQLSRERAAHKRKR